MPPPFAPCCVIFPAETFTMTTLADCRALDAQDPLRALRDEFILPEGVLYLDGNSLGVLPKSAPARIAEVLTKEWGEGLIRSWNTAEPALPGRWCCPRRGGWRSDTKCAKTGGDS